MPKLKIDWYRPKLYAKQEEAIFSPKRNSVIEASTKAGKTVGCIAWLLEEAFTRGAPGREFWWIAPIFGQAEIAFKRMKRYLERAGTIVEGRIHQKSIDSSGKDILEPGDEMQVASASAKLRITLKNGATIGFKSADNPDSLYGEDVWAAVFDEASRAKEESWHAVRSTLTKTRGRLRIIGNVKGRKNFAYRLARRAEMGNDPDWHYAKITAYDAVAGGVLDMKEIEAAKQDLPEMVFRELYLAEPSDDGGNPFGLAAIKRAIRPLSSKPTKAWGWDLAKSVDWTVGIGLDEFGHTTAVERWQAPWQTTVARIKEISGDVPAMVDSTGVGDPILEQLQSGTWNFEGFKFSSASKQQLMEGLAVAIQSEAVGFPEGVVVSELEIFEYEFTRTGVRYTAPEGFHDDCVCALALAVRRLTGPSTTGMLEYYKGILAKHKAEQQQKGHPNV